MKKLDIAISAANDDEEVTATLIVEEQRNGSWRNLRSTTVVTGSPDAKQTLVLTNNQRLVIEGHTSSKIMMDKQQNAAVRVSVPPPPKLDVTIVGDDDLSPETPAVERAMSSPSELGALLAQEDRDRMLTAARTKIKPPTLQADAQPTGEKVEPTTIVAGPSEPATPPTPPAAPSNLPTWAKPPGAAK